MSTSRRQMLQASLALAASGLPLLGRAQQAPFDTATIIAGFAPGGTVDTLARRVAHYLTGKYAPSVVVENKTGAGGQIAVQTTIRAKPDGATFLATPMSMLGLYPHTYKNLPYDPVNDVIPVSLGCIFDFALAVGPAVPASVKTVPAFLEWCKANPQHANFGSPGAGSAPHFFADLIGRTGGVPLQQVAFRGTQPAILDMIGGQIPAVSGPVGEFLPHLVDGRVRILATSGATRSKFAPEAQTLEEQGMKGLVFNEWFGFFAPAKTPPAAINRLNAALVDALKAPDVIEGLATMGLEAASSTPAELGARLKADTELWAPIVKANGFTADS